MYMCQHPCDQKDCPVKRGARWWAPFNKQCLFVAGTIPKCPLTGGVGLREVYSRQLFSLIQSCSRSFDTNPIWFDSPVNPSQFHMTFTYMYLKLVLLENPWSSYWINFGDGIDRNDLYLETTLYGNVNNLQPEFWLYYFEHQKCWMKKMLLNCLDCTGDPRVL